jgi:hypothetical protein
VFGVGTLDFLYLIAVNAAKLTMADDVLPESFHDATQMILSPKVTPSTASQGNDTSACSTPSPLQARQLFPSDGATPQNLCRPSLEVQVSLNMSDVAEEEGEHGDGDSIADAIESSELEEALEESPHHRLLILIKNEGEEVSDIESNRILLKKGLAAEGSMSSVPSDWTPPIAKAEKCEPICKSVDNPGEWPQFTYRPTKNYAHHLLPTGAQPMLVDPHGKRVMGDWEFHLMRNGTLTWYLLLPIRARVGQLPQTL